MGEEVMGGQPHVGAMCRGKPRKKRKRKEKKKERKERRKDSQKNNNIFNIRKISTISEKIPKNTQR